ncbi:hypothetical protein EV1_031572 [Malus domestica]
MMQIEERISAWKLKMVEPHPFANNNDATNNPESQAPASSSNCPEQQHNDRVQVHPLDELPSHLRPCLLYLGMFRNGYTSQKIISPVACRRFSGQKVTYSE